jgi:hypothetical protein
MAKSMSCEYARLANEDEHENKTGKPQGGKYQKAFAPNYYTGQPASAAAIRLARWA